MTVLREANDTGEVNRANAEALARAWLEASGANLAMRVLTSGTHEAANLMALCQRVLDVVGDPGGEVADDGDGPAAEGGAR